MPDAPMTEAALAEIEADTASVAGDEVLVGKETIAALISALRRSWAENADLKAALAKTVEIAKAAMLAEGEWRPIEEAPDDGYVLVFGGSFTEVERVLADGEYWRLLRQKGRKSAPTHFRPLPAPPVSPEAREDALERLAEVEAGVV